MSEVLACVELGDHRLRFETLLAELSAKFINLPAGEVGRQIEDAQRLVCDSLGLDVSSLWQWRPDNPVMHTLTHYYRPLGGPPVPKTMKGQDYFPWCQSRVLAGEIVRISSLADFPPEAARDLEVFSFYGLRSTLTIPLSVGGGPVFGSVNFNDMRRDRLWSDTLVRRLQLVAQIFANALARMRSDQALQESEARLSLAADSAGVGLWSLNLATDDFWLTDKTRELFKFPPREKVTFDRFLSMVHPDDQSSVRETVRITVQAGSEGQVQYRAVLPDGSVRWMLSRGRVRCVASGDPALLMGVTMDITARKQGEFEAQHIHAEITHISRVAAMGELVASLAHELNQPLTAIQSNAQAGQRLIAAGQPDLEDIKDIFADIVADDQRAAEVIRRVRALLKKSAIDRKFIDLNAVIHEVVDLLRTDAIVKGVSVTVSLAPDRLSVLGDRVQLQQVLLNLMANAFDAVRTLPPGERQVSVSSSRSEPDCAVVVVQDSGAGIPADKIAHLFEPFFTTKPEGLGMGLVICRTIVESHGGRISAENAPGRGAVFKFTIPIAEDTQG